MNFLDITLDLHNNKFQPYNKPNDTPIYIHRDSNHPPAITRQLNTTVNKRLNAISCNKEVFDNAKPTYERALKNSGHAPTLTYNNVQDNENKGTKKQRQRNVLWYNPPYCATLKTNFGKEFLRLIDKNFPINNPLHKILNRKTVKISYSCTEDMQKRTDLQ